jgi:FemAB-related protein (PEP-CTERM system-associated)
MLELRSRSRLPDSVTPTHRKVSVHLNLPLTVEDLWRDTFRGKLRSQIRRPAKEGMTSRTGLSELDAFYTVFSRNMRDLGTPVYSRRFFAEVFAAFPDTTRVFLVDSGDLTVAGAITLSWRDTIENPWASSLREYRPLAPNTLMYWRMVEHAIKTGHTTFDFGRSTPGEGTFQFKQQWGAEPSPLHWEYVLADGRSLPNLSPSNPKYRAAIGLWTRLPLAIANRLGPHIVRSIP